MDKTIISGIMNTSEADMAGIAEASTNIISYVENLNIDSLELVQKDVLKSVLSTCTPQASSGLKSSEPANLSSALTQYLIAHAENLDDALEACESCLNVLRNPNAAFIPEEKLTAWLTDACTIEPLEEPDYGLDETTETHLTAVSAWIKENIDNDFDLMDTLTLKELPEKSVGKTIKRFLFGKMKTVSQLRTPRYKIDY